MPNFKRTVRRPTESKSYLTRGKYLCSLALNKRLDKSEQDKSEHAVLCKESTICDPESPLPVGADANELKNLMEEIFEKTDDESSNQKATPKEKLQLPSPKDVEVCTPHPSPDCNINHLENDCDNQYCQWFVQNKQITESPGGSVTTLASTPQANTPMSTTSTPVSSRVRNVTLKRDKGNSRRRYVNEWIDVKRKRLRNLGLQYHSRNGLERAAKSIGAGCSTSCRKKCSERINLSQRQSLFQKFWGLGDRHKQWTFIANLVKTKKCRVYTDRESKRQYTLKYKLPAVDCSNYIDVCKIMFLNTFSISDQFVYTSLNKMDDKTGVIAPDLRGKHKNQPKVITEDVKLSVCDHIKCIQPVESHYCRKSSNKLYLDGDLNFKRLFILYNEWFDSNSYSGKAMTERQYRDIVNENFKLSFFIPKKDQCDQCHVYKNLKKPSCDEIIKHTIHLNNKNVARELKSLDKIEAKKQDSKVLSATFDFQKVLNAPHGQLSILYYKRKLSVFNFTLFDIGKKDGTCYMWHEGQGRRGANEVASCLVDFISSNVRNGFEDFRFWSDNCTGQNRNRIVFAAYVYAAKKFKVNIKHRFLEKGHTQAEGDSVHAVIERMSKNKCIYTPSEWFALVRWAKEERPYTVKEMHYSKFFNFKELLKNRNWLKNTKGDKVEWTKVKEVCIFANDPWKINLRYDLCREDSSTILVSANTRSKKNDLSDNLVNHLYQRPLPIQKAKKDDLMSLLNNGIIPNNHKEFFEGLISIDKDLPLDFD